MAAVITELRLAQLAPDDLREAAPELVPLMEPYESELCAAGLTDWAGVLKIAHAAAGGGRPGRLVGLPTLLVDVPISSEAEFGFVGALAARAPELLATVPAADEATLGRMRYRLLAEVENIDPPSDESGSLANLQRHLFSEERSAVPLAADDGVQVFSAPGEGRECVEIARRVLAVARSGVPFDAMAVILRSPEAYRANLKEAFNRAGIPAHFVRGAIRPDPAGRAFCALLKCAAEPEIDEQAGIAERPVHQPGLDKLAHV